MKVMRIVLITSKLNFEPDGSPVGGSVVDLHLKAKGLSELWHDITVVTAFSDADRIPCALPYKVFERRILSRTLIGLQRGVYALLKEFEHNADIFYIDGHMFLYGGGAYRMRGGKVPVVGFFNIRLNAWADTGGTMIRPSLYRRAKKKVRFFLEQTFGAPIANHLDAYIFNTPQVQKLYHDFGVGKKGQHAVIPDFVATKELGNRFSVSADGVRAHQETAEPIILIATGRMIPEKGFDMLLQAFARVTDKQKYRVLLSGGGPERERLEKLSDDLGVRPFVEFPGWVPREALYRFFAKAHIFVFPKWWIEYGSAVLTEAMAFGLPSIIPGGGALEWLTVGSALTFSNDSVDELTKHIETLGRDGALRVRLGEKALARATKLDYLKLATQLEQVVVSVTPHSGHRVRTASITKITA